MRYRYTIHERLKREQHIKTLFQTGKAFSLFPLKCIWLQLPRSNAHDAPARLAISVPKKRIPLAVHRNRIKRLIREAWRLNKHLFYAQVPAGQQYHLFYIYTGQSNPDFKSIELAVLKIIDNLCLQMGTPNHA